MSPRKATQKSTKSTIALNTKSKGFTDEERAAMKERARELKAEAHANTNKADGESDVLAKIAEMQGPDRAMAQRLHVVITASVPVLAPKTWYGMPRMPRTARLCASSKARRSSNRDTRH